MIHPFQVYNAMDFSTFTELYDHNHDLNMMLGHFHLPKKKPFIYYPSLPTSLSLSSPWELLAFLSPRVCLFWTFHTNEIIHLVVFCVWLLSFRMVFGFIHIVVCITSFLFYDSTIFHLWI